MVFATALEETFKVLEIFRITTLKNIKYILICLERFGLLYDMCYFIVLMSSLLFYNVEHSTDKEKPWNE